MEKILISACFLGKKVRYNGKIKNLIHPQLAIWQRENRLVDICPECIGGLPVPRPAAEINPANLNVYTKNGDNVTSQFTVGATNALALCKKLNINFALLKESSPSCGSNFIYDGSFSNQKITGNGVTTALLRKNNVQVYSEDTIDLLISEIKKLEEAS